MEGIVFIGLQASGKSSFYASKFSKTHMRLNMDMLKTRYRENILFKAFLESKQPCVIDNTNPTRSDREKYISKFKQHKFQISGYYFASKIEDCMRRNAERCEKDRIPEIGIKATSKKLELPDYDEGFDKLYYVQINGGQFIIKDWDNEI